MKKIAVGGGDVVTICSACSGNSNARGGSWAEDGTIFFSPGPQSALRRVPSAGGSHEPLTKLDAATGEITHRWPKATRWKGVMFTANNQTGDFEEANIVVQSLPNGPRKIVQRGGYYGRYLGSGHLGYMRGGTLFAASFDIGRLELTGEPVPTLKGIGGSSSFGGADLSFSSRGALAFVPGAGIPLVVPIQWMDFKGASQSLRCRAGFQQSPAVFAGLQQTCDGYSRRRPLRRVGLRMQRERCLACRPTLMKNGLRCRRRMESASHSHEPVEAMQTATLLAARGWCDKTELLLQSENKQMPS